MIELSLSLWCSSSLLLSFLVSLSLLLACYIWWSLFSFRSLICIKIFILALLKRISMSCFSIDLNGASFIDVLLHYLMKLLSMVLVFSSTLTCIFLEVVLLGNWIDLFLKQLVQLLVYVLLSNQVEWIACSTALHHWSVFRTGISVKVKGFIGIVVGVVSGRVLMRLLLLMMMRHF